MMPFWIRGKNGKKYKVINCEAPGYGCVTGTYLVVDESNKMLYVSANNMKHYTYIGRVI